MRALRSTYFFLLALACRGGGSANDSVALAAASPLSRAAFPAGSPVPASGHSFHNVGGTPWFEMVPVPDDAPFRLFDADTSWPRHCPKIKEEWRFLTASAIAIQDSMWLMQRHSGHYCREPEGLAPDAVDGVQDSGWIRRAGRDTIQFLSMGGSTPAGTVRGWGAIRGDTIVIWSAVPNKKAEVYVPVR